MKRSLFSLLRDNKPLSMAEYASWFGFNGVGYPYVNTVQTLLGSKQEEIPPTLRGYVELIFKANPIVFGCMMARLSLFSEARFTFREKHGEGRPSKAYGTKGLASLEEPWPGASTGDLLKRMILDVDLTGNFYAAKRGNRIFRLRPDWVTVLLGSRVNPSADVSFGDLDVEPIGYMYEPGGRAHQKEPILLMPDEVAHFAPIPDPISAFRGMSWLTPILRDIQGDQAGTEHKLQYLEKGATPNAVIKPDAKVPPEKFQRFKEIFEESSGNSYGTLFLGGGADYTAVGNDMTKVDFKAIQALGENRICVAARVPSIIAGVSEGLEASTYSNVQQAKRIFADGTVSPLWASACAALETLIQVPAGAELYYNDRAIPYLQEDRKDEAESMRLQAEAAHRLFEAGFEPDSITEAIVANDISRLKHSGLPSVQLQTGKGVLETNPKEEPPSAPNGKGNPDAIPVPAKGEAQ